MRRAHGRLNFTGLVLSALFAAGTVWLWRGYDSAGPLYSPELPDREEAAAPSEPAIILAESRGSFPKDKPAVATLQGSRPVSTTAVLALAEQQEATASSSPVRKTTRDASSLLTGWLELSGADVNLAVPYASQAPERNWEQPWQDACEEAALLMLDAYYKGYGLSPLFAKDELQKMVDWETARGWGGSISIDKIKRLSDEYLKIGRPVHVIENPTATQIKDYVATGHPVLVVADGKILPNPYYSNGGPVYHALIIRGFTADKFITNDPGVNRGANFVFEIEDLMSAIRDWNGGDVKQGRRVVLVVE